MGIGSNIQPEIIIVNNKIRLVYAMEGMWHLARDWYSDPEIMYMSEGVEDKVYGMYEIERMYKSLSSTGELYFIQYLDGEWWISIGDVTLSEINFPIVIGNKKFWGHGIGRLVVGKLIERAREIGLTTLRIPEIYHYNKRSKRLFQSFGFKEECHSEESTSYYLNL